MLAVTPNLWVRVWRGALQVVAGVGCVGAIAVGIFEVVPAWQQVLLWSDYRRAEVVVHALDVVSKPSDWSGRGEINGQEIDFRRHELQAFLGPVPPLPAEALAATRARLPLRATVLWHPDAWRRVLAQDAKSEGVAANARFGTGFFAVFLGVGLIALILDRLVKRRVDPSAAQAHAQQRALERQGRRMRPARRHRDSKR